jgi:hypothetical protein
MQQYKPFSGCGNNGKVRPRVELDVLSLFFYADQYLKLDTKKNGRTGLVSSAKKQSYVNQLDSLLQDPNNQQTTKTFQDNTTF